MLRERFEHILDTQVERRRCLDAFHFIQCQSPIRRAFPLREHSAHDLIDVLFDDSCEQTKNIDDSLKGAVWRTCLVHTAIEGFRCVGGPRFEVLHCLHVIPEVWREPEKIELN